MRLGIVSRTATYWPLETMERDGFPIELVEIERTSAGVDALLDGSVDVAATCPDALVAAGAPLRIAGGLVDRPPTSLVSVAAVREIAQLAGRRVAVTEPRGSVSLFLRALLRAHGVTGYEPVVCGPTPKQAAALERGEVDAAMLTMPFDEQLVERGFRLLARVGDELGPCAFTTLNVREGWSATEEWRRFRAALESAIGRLRERERGQMPAYDVRVDLSGVERLLAFMRAEGVAVAASAHAYLDADAAVR